MQPLTSVRLSHERGVRALALLLTVAEVAERLGCGRTFVYELISSGELETVKLRRLRRVPAAALDAWSSAPSLWATSVLVSPRMRCQTRSTPHSARRLKPRGPQPLIR
ncbi:MAG TPA: helix-turn-helix domain-containing protein [Candidatus Dormibacteraeota bacterium]